MTTEEKEKHRRRRKFKIREKKNWFKERQDKVTKHSDTHDSEEGEIYRKYRLKKILPSDE